MNTYILVEPKIIELTTAINNVEKFYFLCINNNCFSDDLKRNSIDVMLEIEEVKTFMAAGCHTMDEVSHRKQVCDTFLNDARQLLREMSIAVSKCF